MPLGQASLRPSQNADASWRNTRAQIIVHGKSGFHIDPYHGRPGMLSSWRQFFEAAAKDTERLGEDKA